MLQRNAIVFALFTWGVSHRNSTPHTAMGCGKMQEAQ
jgi:hypothetical protein